MAPHIPRKQVDWSKYDTNLVLLRSHILQGDYPPPEFLADVVDANRSQPLPNWFLDLVSAQLRGALKRKRGRPARSEWQKILIEIADWDYQRHISWLQKRKRSLGLQGWSCIRDKEWWEGPPHQRALSIVFEYYSRKHNEFGKMGLSRFRNLISSRK